MSMKDAIDKIEYRQSDHNELRQRGVILYLPPAEFVYLLGSEIVRVSISARIKYACYKSDCNVPNCSYMYTMGLSMKLQGKYYSR